MASLPRASCLYILQIFESICFSFFAVSRNDVLLFVEAVSLYKARLKCPL
jgi:hypothetical protein